MAVFRLICIENRAKSITKMKLVQKIHLAELALITCTVSLISYGLFGTGWEQAPMYQYCKDFGTTKAGIFHDYRNGHSQYLGKVQAHFSKNLVQTNLPNQSMTYIS